MQLKPSSFMTLWNIINHFECFKNPFRFPGGLMAKNLCASAGDTGSVPESGRSSGSKNWQPTPVFLHGKFLGHRDPVSYSQWGHKELDMPEQLITYIQNLFEPFKNVSRSFIDLE